MKWCSFAGGGREVEIKHKEHKVHKVFFVSFVFSVLFVLKNNVSRLPKSVSRNGFHALKIFPVFLSLLAFFACNLERFLV